MPSLSKNDSNISKKRNISPLSNFTTNYKTKKIRKGYIHRQKQNVSREINTSTPGIPLRSHLPISITISNGNGLKDFQKNTSFSAKYTKKGLKSSNMNSPSYAKSNATNFDFAINQNEQESVQKTKGDLRNYLKQNFYNSPERHLQSQEDESRKQSLYQGGFVEDKEDEKLSEGECQEINENPKIVEILSERGNMAESPHGSIEENKNVALQKNDKPPIEYKGFKSIKKTKDNKRESYGAYNNVKKEYKMENLKERNHDIGNERHVDSDSEDEEKVFYRGRGISKEIQNTEIPEQYRVEKDLTPDMFKIESLLGKGAFGKVYLVTQKGTNQQYAMKVLSKAQIIENKITRYALSEKNVMSKIPHPFIVKLNFAFQTKDFLYLILDYCPGGNVGDLLDRVNNLEENTAKLFT